MTSHMIVCKAYKIQYKRGEVGSFVQMRSVTNTVFDRGAVSRGGGGGIEFLDWGSDLRSERSTLELRRSKENFGSLHKSLVLARSSEIDQTRHEVPQGVTEGGATFG